MLSAGTAPAAVVVVVVVITSRWRVPVFSRTRRVDGDQTLCAACGLG
ncbi:MAG: hypothetical protein JWR32_4478 [Mycobacterium sp.]|jgi:hypothetical protein|nr:hypothetical protein [Mycobacterium sp.]